MPARATFLENQKLGYSSVQNCEVRASANRRRKEQGKKKGKRKKKAEQKANLQMKDRFKGMLRNIDVRLLSRKTAGLSLSLLPFRNAIRSYGGNRDRYRGQRR